MEKTIIRHFQIKAHKVDIYIHIYIYIYTHTVTTCENICKIILLKGTWGQSSPPAFMSCFLNIFGVRNLCKVFRRFVQFSQSYKVTSFSIRRKWHHTHEQGKNFTAAFICIFWLILWRKNLIECFMVFLTIFHEMMRYKSLK